MKPYRKNVGIVVFNAAGMALAGERLDTPGWFQYPQGGLDGKEEPLLASRRELYEETGLKMEDDPIGILPGDDEWLYYDFPREMPGRLKKYRGQKQKWYFFYWDGNLSTLNLELHKPEFSGLQWMSLTTLCDSIVAFKQPIYERIRDEGGKLIRDFLEKK